MAEALEWGQGETEAQSDGVKGGTSIATDPAGNECLVTARVSGTSPGFLEEVAF